MKRSIILFLMTCVFANTFAQHLSFIGIELGQPSAAFDRSLRQKGFIKQNNYGMQNLVLYSGDFWKIGDVSLLVFLEEGKVTSITVSKSDNRTNSTFSDIVNGLNKKYGKYTNKKGSDYTWKVNGGEIMAINDKKDIMIMYTDRTSSSFIRKYQKRDKNDDL